MQPSDFGWNGHNGWFTVMIAVATFWLLMIHVPFLTQYTGHVILALIASMGVFFVLILTRM